MVSEATIEAYKAMTNEQGCASMKEQIQENLERTCDKFAGNEDKLERCLLYLEECASEILEGKNGNVPDEVCFRICRDYFNDEIWKKEDEEAAQAKAEAEERARLAAEKKAKNKKGKKAAPDGKILKYYPMSETMPDGLDALVDSFAVAFFSSYATKEKWHKMERKCLAKMEEYR